MTAPVTRPGTRAVTDLSRCSYGEFMLNIWRLACQGLDVAPRRSAPVTALLARLWAPWAGRELGATPCYRSYISASGLPFELAVNVGPDATELRVLWESLGDPATVPTPRTCQDAGAATTRQLAGLPSVVLDRYLRIEDLFLAQRPVPGAPTVWPAMRWRPGEHPTFRVYLNADVPGAAEPVHLVADAMRRLGLDQAWRAMYCGWPDLRRRGITIRGIGLDLDDTATARVKVYFVQPVATPADVDRVAAFATRHTSDRVGPIYRHLLGHEAGAPVATCLSFRGGHEAAVSANVYLTLPADVTTDDRAAGRVATLMCSTGVDPLSYVDIVRAVTGGPGRRHEYVSCRTDPDQVDITAYLRFAPWR
jgi:DMATS type aromatic prenyltransferase